MLILFLDDDETRIKAAKQLFIGHQVVYCKTAAEAITAMSNNYFELCSLDHDLGGGQMLASDEKSGFAVVQHLAELDRCLHPEYVIIHSFNPAGAENMLNYIYSMNEHLSSEITPIKVLFGSKEYIAILAKLFI